MSSLLPFLLLAACPIAMILMMRGMHKHGAQDAAAKPRAADESLDVTQLRELRNDLETRMEDLDARIYDLETTRPTTGVTTAVRTE